MPPRKRAVLPVADPGATAAGMDEPENSRARRSTQKARAERLAAALRENLKRRKLQARSRAKARHQAAAADQARGARVKSGED